jgi:hypothetical protein
MQLTRRKFIGYVGMAAAVGTSLFTAGCNAITDLKNWIPVALTSVAAIVKLLGPLVPAPVQATIVLIEDGFSALLTAIQNYQAGTSVLSDVTNAISAVETAFASFFQSLSVPSTLLNLIEGLAGIILSTISAFAAQISPASAITKPQAMLGGRQVTYTPVKRSIGKYRSDWDAMCVQAGHPEARI